MKHHFIIATFLLIAIITKAQKISNKKAEYYTNSDIRIPAANGVDTLKFTKQKFNEIVDHFPALYSEIPFNPDASYYFSGLFKKFIDSNGKEKTISFDCEVCRDEYYILYAYFLQKRNTGDELAQRRKTLLAIFDDLNDIFGTLAGGGTGFGHQYRRINGYAEYAVYLYKNYSDDYKKSYPIAKQKQLYISALKQIISDEVVVDFDIIVTEADKEKRKQKLYKIVNHLDSLITDYFYLSQAREFQYSQY